MKKKYLEIFVIFLSIIVLSGCTAKSKNTISNGEQFNNILMNYFIEKDTNQLPLLINFISSKKMLEKQKNTKAPLMGFFAGIYHENEDLFEQLEEMKLSNSALSLLSSSKEFEEIAEDMLSHKDYVLESPEALDSFWGYFFATGRDDVIQKLCYTSENSGDTIVKGAAKWSLDSNRKQFPNKIKKCSDYTK